MDTYKFDWKDVVHGSIEIKASNSAEAIEKFKKLSQKDLYNISEWDTDGKEIEIKFIENKDAFHDAFTPEEYKSNGKNLLDEWDTHFKWFKT